MKMKEANTEPIDMSLEELFQFALNIEEAEINPGKILRAILAISKSREPKPDSSEAGGKGKNHKKSGGKNSILKGQELPSSYFCGREGHTKTACRIKQKSMASDKKDTKYISVQWKKDKAK
jgi:hypothetical protein